MSINITHHHNITFHTRVVTGITPTISVRVSPRCEIRETIRHRCCNSAADRVSTRLQALQITKCFVMQLPHRVVFFINPGSRPCTAEFIQIVDNAADRRRGVRVWIIVKNTCIRIPLGPRIPTRRSIVLTSNAVCFCTHIFHGSAKNAAITTTSVVTRRLIQQIAKRSKAHLIAIFLNNTGRLIITIRILFAKIIVARILQSTRHSVADLHPGVEKTVRIQRRSGGWRSPRARVVGNVATLGLPRPGISKNCIGARNAVVSRCHFPLISATRFSAIPHFFYTRETACCIFCGAEC